MTPFSRRTFLGHASAASLCALGDLSYPRIAGAFAVTTLGESLHFPFPGQWSAFGRLIFQQTGNAVTLCDGFAISSESHAECDFRFRARAPEGTEQVQIWAGIRCRDRASRYVFGLRGGNNNDVYLARYAPEGGAKFLGIAPLGFHPEPGAWYNLRAVARNNRFHLYVNDESVPRINITDDTALWSEGGVALGGGWLPVEFRDVEAGGIGEADAAAFDALADRVWQPAGFDREIRRAQQRAAYRGASIAAFAQPRTEVSLDGKWLFSPDQELAAGAAPEAVDFDDKKSHVMDVPDFWTPTFSWLYGETSFSYLHDGLSISKGICDQFYEAEMSRLDNYTFDWKNTRSAWYRHSIELPEDLAGRRFELCFDAIAKVSEVWVNGTKVASHVGMFGEVKCDITGPVRPGRNIMAVHVMGRLAQGETSNQVMGVAVTVEVTSAMLNSLPHGMFREDASGIWQPVKLIVTGNTAITDVFIKPRLNGLDCELQVRNSAAEEVPVSVSYSIRSRKDRGLLHTSPPGEQQVLAAGTRDAKLAFSTPSLTPKLWSPQEPNLYDLEIELVSGGRVIDRRSFPVGFRTFSVQGNRLMLNGKPLWLRGGDHFPNSLKPNDATLAREFIRLAREGNVHATRSHTVPYNETWLAAADEGGMAVSYEGTWPWLMLEGDPPSSDLLRVWKEEFASLIAKYRNHPSIVIWTVNNEMKFEHSDQRQPERLKKKWVILTDMIKTMRSIDPTRPIVCDSSYCRKEVAAEYENLIVPEKYDDGDIDDAHRYPGWYEPSFFHFYQGEFGKSLAWPDRPLISQEMSTGYPRNDDGHCDRFYLFIHYTAQSLVGDEGYENRDPGIFLHRQTFMTKELAEVLRRTGRENCSGILHFAYLTWFKNVWNAETIQPWETYQGLKRALQPVLVSAELYGRHFYAGTTPSFRVCLLNDAEDFAGLPATKLSWQVRGSGKILASGNVPVDALPYYENRWLDVTMALPESLPSPRMDATFALRLEGGGKVFSENEYDIVLATRALGGGGTSRELRNSALRSQWCCSRGGAGISRGPRDPFTRNSHTRPGLDCRWR